MPKPREAVVTTEPTHISESEQDTSDDHFSDASEGAQEENDGANRMQAESATHPFGYGEEPGTRRFEKKMVDAHTEETLIVPKDIREDEHEGSTSNPENAVNEFDEFEEGDEDNDFGAFDEATIEIQHQTEGSYPQSSFSPLPPILSYDNCSTREEVVDACRLYIDDLFSSLEPAKGQQSASDVNPSLLNERSQSLWAQLVAPPPLQPPNWVRSRIRRLFLVSLGVPVDLDEILPASKQKKLILPSIEVGTGHAGPVTGSTLPQSGDVAKLKNDNGSAVSVSSQGGKSDKRRRGAAAAPDFDLNTARLICTRTETALQNLTDAELKTHIGELEQLKHKASELLQYWLVQKDSAIGDKEAFEEVIENLVKHAKKIRK